MLKTHSLIVEDNVIAAKVLTIYCEKSNAIVDHASTGEMASVFLSHWKFDLIFMDLGLPLNVNSDD